VDGVVNLIYPAPSPIADASQFYIIAENTPLADASPHSERSGDLCLPGQSGAGTRLCNVVDQQQCGLAASSPVQRHLRPNITVADAPIKQDTP